MRLFPPISNISSPSHRENAILNWVPTSYWFLGESVHQMATSLSPLKIIWLILESGRQPMLTVWSSSIIPIGKIAEESRLHRKLIGRLLSGSGKTEQQKSAWMTWSLAAIRIGQPVGRSCLFLCSCKPANLPHPPSLSTRQFPVPLILYKAPTLFQWNDQS